MLKKSLLFTFVAVFISMALVAQSPQSPKKDKELRKLVKFMTGSFHSGEQAAQDSSFFKVHLTMTPIWQDRNIGYWLYVEQAMSTALNKPYRQRVYHVYRDDKGRLVSAVYTLPSNPLRFAGAFKQAKPLDQLTPDSLSARTGCEIILQKEGKVFKGSTGEQSCPSDLRGAAFATSTVEISQKTLLSWDRGFDANGKQVWGAVKGGYIFKKQ
ncbi:MAG: chromophore lyase CpcT/CpeT [Thermoflexibacteraceae bacterium]